MSGVTAALAGGEGSGGGGGTMAPLSWANIYGSYAGSNAPLTIGGITSAHTLTASWTGIGTVAYILNGTSATYSGGFAVHAGDTLAWLVTNSAGGPESGTVYVYDASAGGALVDSFTYVLTERYE